MKEKAKENLKQAYKSYKKRGFSLEEALSKAIVEVRDKFEKKTFEEALKEFLEELTEVDPLVALSEAIYEEYELLLPKIKALFKGRGKEGE